jgi:DnaJ family protein C protein 28
MDFKDWRKAAHKPIEEALRQETQQAGKLRGRKFQDYIEEQIQEAMARGEFANLPGTGKPLNLDDDPYAGDKASAYRLLKNEGYAPPEIELLKEIRHESERIEQKLGRLCNQGKALRARRVPSFESEKRAYNAAIEKAAAEYEQTLRTLNRKILTFNLTVPLSMHLPLFEVEKLVQQFRESCPLLA